MTKECECSCCSDNEQKELIEAIIDSFEYNINDCLFVACIDFNNKRRVLQILKGTCYQRLLDFAETHKNNYSLVRCYSLIIKPKHIEKKPEELVADTMDNLIKKLEKHANTYKHYSFDQRRMLLDAIEEIKEFLQGNPINTINPIN